MLGLKLSLAILLLVIYWLTGSEMFFFYPELKDSQGQLYR